MATGTLAPPPTKLLTADEFMERHGDESRVDLVDGHVVRYPMPFAEHGYVGNKLCVRLTVFVEDRKLGRVFNNDTFIRVKANKVRGADCAFLSYTKLPVEAEVPQTYLAAPMMPELVAEVKSPSDSWPEVLVKVQDYLDAGVEVVLVLDPATKSIKRYHAEGEIETIPESGTLTLPEVFPDFSCSVAGLFA